MFTLTGSGIRNILFDARLLNPAQFASKKVHNFHFFPAPCQKASTLVGSSGRQPTEFGVFQNHAAY